MYNEKLDFIERKARIASLVARGIIRKHIDNLLNFYWFPLWLKEGFIIFLQAYIIDEVLLSLTLFEYPIKIINNTTMCTENS